jgi:hypothetical protein
MTQEDRVLVEGWITTTEAVEVSGYAREYLRRLARNERVASQKLAGRWLFKESSLMQYKNKMDSLGRAKYDPRGVEINEQTEA